MNKHHPMPEALADLTKATAELKGRLDGFDTRLSPGAPGTFIGRILEGEPLVSPEEASTLLKLDEASPSEAAPQA